MARRGACKFTRKDESAFWRSALLSVRGTARGGSWYVEVDAADLELEAFAGRVTNVVLCGLSMLETEPLLVLACRVVLALPRSRARGLEVPMVDDGIETEACRA